MALHTEKTLPGIPTLGIPEGHDGIHISPGRVEVVVNDVAASVFTASSVPMTTQRHTLSAAAAGTGVRLSIPNPFGASAYVKDVIARIDTPAGGTCTLDIGVANNGTTSSDTVLDGINANSAAGSVFYSLNATDAGTNGRAKPVVCGATQFLNIAVATGNAGALVLALQVVWARL